MVPDTSGSGTKTTRVANSIAVRRPFDHAAGADAGETAPGTAGGNDGPHATASEDPGVTPNELYVAYLNLGEHDRICRGRLDALQGWVQERLIAADDQHR